MAKQLNALRILVVGPDDLALAGLTVPTHPEIALKALTPADLAADRGTFSHRDVLVVSVDAAGGPGLLADLCARPGMPPVIALAGRGADGMSLEHTLLLAELRGAALALPRPIDATELALAALELIRARSGAARRPRIARDRETRLAC